MILDFRKTMQKYLFMLALGMLSGGAARAQEVKPLKGYPVAASLGSYKSLPLKADLSQLSYAEKEALKYLIEAAKAADEIFWMQTWGPSSPLLDSTRNDTLRRFIALNYGPWDRLNDNKPFVEGIGVKPKGARFYPEDMRAGEYDSLTDPRKSSPYTIIRRDPSGKLVVLNYSEAYADKIHDIIRYLHMAADLMMSVDMQMGQFLHERAMAVMQNDYNQSDIAWLGLLNNNLDVIIGPIENYEDELYGSKTAFEAYVLIRDKEWGRKLEKYVAYLPELQQSLPVPAAYKPALADQVKPSDAGAVNPTPGQPIFATSPATSIEPEGGKPGSSLAVFDVVYYAGHNNAGSKTIAVNLPNDEKLQEEYGTRRSQLKNVMKAKFDNMVVPISGLMIDEKQVKNITFEAFFSNVMFHEVAHGLGVKNTVNGKGSVREALGAGFSAIEECKADVLGLYMVTQLFDKKELSGSLDDYYVTFVASVFRSVRFGAASAHGKANMIIFNTLLSKGAIVRQKNGKYKVDVALMKTVISELAAELLTLQGDGNTGGVTAMLETRAQIGQDLKKDLDKIAAAGIPVDLIFEQGTKVLGLE